MSVWGYGLFVNDFVLKRENKRKKEKVLPNKAYVFFNPLKVPGCRCNYVAPKIQDVPYPCVIEWNGIPFAIRLRKSNTLWNDNTNVGSITAKFRRKILADFGILDHCIEFLPNTTWLQSIN